MFVLCVLDMHYVNSLILFICYIHFFALFSFAAVFAMKKSMLNAAYELATSHQFLRFHSYGLGFINRHLYIIIHFQTVIGVILRCPSNIRYRYDWARDVREKLNDRFVFPKQLDMRPFVSGVQQDTPDELLVAIPAVLYFLYFSEFLYIYTRITMNILAWRSMTCCR